MKQTGEKHCKKCKTKDDLHKARWLCNTCLREYDKLRSSARHKKERDKLAEWKPVEPEPCGFYFDECACPLRQQAAQLRAKRGQTVQMPECLNCKVKKHE